MQSFRCEHCDKVVMWKESYTRMGSRLWTLFNYICPVCSGIPLVEDPYAPIPVLKPQKLKAVKIWCERPDCHRLACMNYTFEVKETRRNQELVTDSPQFWICLDCFEKKTGVKLDPQEVFLSHEESDTNWHEYPARSLAI